MRVLFASWHFYIDQSNGASVTTREILRALARRDWEVFTFCGSAVDDWRRADVKRSLARRGLTALRKVEQCDSVPFTTFSFRDEGINSILFSPEDRSQVPSKDVGTAFLRLLTSVLRRVKPDVVVTYGGYWLGGAMLKAAHDVGAKTVVLLQNFAYNDREYFRDADLVITPSQFSSNVYRERLGLKTVAIPPLIDWSNVVPDASDAASDSACRDRLLFVNPSPQQGRLTLCAYRGGTSAIATRYPDSCRRRERRRERTAPYPQGVGGRRRRRVYEEHVASSEFLPPC